MDTTPYDEPLDPLLAMDDPALAPWLVGVSEDERCGADIEYDNDFLALTQAAAGKPETQFSAAEPPDWVTVRSLAESLNERTRDLRVASLWMRARLATEGFQVLGPCLRLFEQLLSRWWDELHPQTDDGDAFARLNVLGELNSLGATLGDIRQSMVLRDRSIRQVSVREIEIALGHLIPRDDESVPNRGQIESMLADALSDNPHVGTQATAALSALDALSECLSTRVGYGEQPDFEPLRTLLKHVASVSPGAPDADTSDDAYGNAGNDGSGDSDSDAAPVRRSRSSAGGMGSIESRADAVRAIGLVCDYLELNEPTNPASHLLRRAQRLIDRNFLQLVREFAPEALGEVAKMLGVDPDTLEFPS